jgi:dinuclear metal center YbgI/SA1388 family protein
MAELEQILYFLEDLFRPGEFPDYSHALNGLQVEGPSEVSRVAAAVDASEETVLEAVRRDVDLLVVHHGLFWGGLGPLTGPRFRKVEALIQGKVALYSMHLPLDAHPELGNNALLIDALGLESAGGFGSFKDMEIGFWARAEGSVESLRSRLAEVVEGDVRLIPGGPERVSRVGMVSGGGSSTLEEASAKGLDTLVTGEAPHHAYHDAMELGVNLLLAGHYATETFGVRALVERLGETFGTESLFLPFPTGL